MKICKICKIEKSLENFYKHPKTKDGYQEKCKDCAKSLSDERYKKLIKIPEFQEKERVRRKKPPREKVVWKTKNQVYLDSKARYPEKYKVHTMMKHYDKTNTHHLHHWSYNEEHFDDCIQLLPSEHRKAHKFMIYDQERFMYRRIDTMELLDSKESHEEYIKNLK